MEFESEDKGKEEVKISITKPDYIETFMLIFGFLAPAPIIAFFSITGYVYCLFICAIICLIHISQNGLKYCKDRVFLAYAVWVIVCYAFCAFRMPKTWVQSLPSSFLQFLLLIFIYYSFESVSTKLKKAFVLGVYYSAIFQMIWAYLQYIFFLFDMDINTLIFDGIFHTVDETASQISYFGLKLSGLCWNSANMAPLMVFGFLFSKKKIAKILFVVVSFISNNRTLMAGMALCLILLCGIQLVQKHGKIKKRIFAGGLGLIFVFLIGIILFWSRFTDAIDKIVWLFDVVSNAKTEPSTFVHLRYLISVPVIAMKNDLLTNVIGYGPGCSGYAFAKYYNQYVEGAWVVECDYINVLWNYGFGGFAIFYYWLISNMVRTSKGSNELKVFFISILFMGIMYNVIFNWVMFLLLVMFSMRRDGGDFLDSFNHKLDAAS